MINVCSPIGLKRTQKVVLRQKIYVNVSQNQLDFVYLVLKTKKKGDHPGALHHIMFKPQSSIFAVGSTDG